MSKEQQSNVLDEHTQKYRQRLRQFLGVPLKTEIERDPKKFKDLGIGRAVDHLNKGGGLIVFTNHFDRVDPIHVLTGLCDFNSAFAHTEMVIPIADHQKMDAVHLTGIASRAGVSIKPLVTENSVTKYANKLDKGNFLTKIGPVQTAPQITEFLKKDLPKKGAGTLQFIKAARSSLERGGIVYVPTQPERATQLEQPVDRPLGFLVNHLRKAKVNNVGILFVGVSMPGTSDYSQKGGLNLFKTHYVKSGSFVNIEEAVEEAENIGNLDEWAILQVAKLLPPELVSTGIQKKLLEKSSKYKV